MDKKILLMLILSFTVASCSSTKVTNEVYHVCNIIKTPEINGEWNKDPWKDIELIFITNHVGDKSNHKPVVKVKAAYDKKAIYVLFQVHDRFVRCSVEEYQGPVWEDSCVEFFFTPSSDVSQGYFNLEINCGGTAFFAYQKAPGKGRIHIPRENLGIFKLPTLSLK